MVTAPLPSMLDGRDSSRTTWSCLSWSSAASSMVTIRSSEGMKEERTFRVVVLPAPVPPDTTTLSRPRTHASRKSAVLSLSEPNLIRSFTVNGSAANLRMVSDAAVDGQRGYDGVDTASVGETGVDHRGRLVHPAADARDDLVDRPPQVRLVLELAVDLDQLALALEVDVEGAVDHHLGDVDVAQVGLERAVAEDVVGDVLGDPLAVAAGQRPVARRQHVGEDDSHLGLELGGLEVGVVQLGTELLEELAVHALLEVLEPVLGRPCARCRLGRRSWWCRPS